MLVLSQVSKRYGDTVALAPTDLQVPAGETVVLIGSSGCGKSTLLRLIDGLIQPDSGAITFEGTALTPANILQLDGSPISRPLASGRTLLWHP